MKPLHDTFTLDTSAILALWNNEEGADTVERILREAKGQQPVLVSLRILTDGHWGMQTKAQKNP